METESLEGLNKIDITEIESECVGSVFIQYYSKLHCDDSNSVASSSSENEKETPCELDFDINYLKILDPKEWKSQDHYAVLGLKNVRHKAKASDIKYAYRQIVLNHHPDKRKARGESVDHESDYFTCITMAWEILGDAVKRRSYDSVDPMFDDQLPSSSSITNDDQFYKIFGEQFEKNSRWSVKKPVPKLGGPKDSRATVERFYSFWYNFESWREYSYEDEESKEKGQYREERKWIEKQNKAVRAKKKKEEMNRIRSLVEMSSNLDPRIKQYKQEDKDKKESIKRAKAEAARARQEEIDRVKKQEEEEKKRIKEEQEANEKAKQMALKAEREQQKKMLKKERKTLRDTCKQNNYYTSSQEEEMYNMKSVELLCETLTCDELKDLNIAMKDSQEAFFAKVADVEKKIEQEKLNSINLGMNRNKDDCPEDSKDRWSDSQITLLIKAVNLYPAGTNQRWEVISHFINQHAKSGTYKNAKDALIKAKQLKNNGDASNLIRQVTNQKAYQQFEKQKNFKTQVDDVETTQRFEDSPWTSEEQKLLEQALKKYPSSISDRWDQIASCIPTRNKKDCLKRYKELVEMVKAKKLSQTS